MIRIMKFQGLFLALVYWFRKAFFPQLPNIYLHLGEIDWGEQKQVTCVCICPSVWVVLHLSTQHIFYQHWCARKRCCICGMQLTRIYFYLEKSDLAFYMLGKKKKTMKEFSLM